MTACVGLKAHDLEALPSTIKEGTWLPVLIRDRFQRLIWESLHIGKWALRTFSPQAAGTVKTVLSLSPKKSVCTPRKHGRYHWHCIDPPSGPKLLCNLFICTLLTWGHILLSQSEASKLSSPPDVLYLLEFTPFCMISWAKNCSPCRVPPPYYPRRVPS